MAETNDLLAEAVKSLESIQKLIEETNKATSETARASARAGRAVGGSARTGVFQGVGQAVGSKILEQLTQIALLASTQVAGVNELRDAIDKLGPTVSAAQTVGGIASQAARLGFDVDPALLRARAQAELAAEERAAAAFRQAQSIVVEERFKGLGPVEKAAAIGAAGLGALAAIKVLR